MCKQTKPSGSPAPVIRAAISATLITYGDNMYSGLRRLEPFPIYDFPDGCGVDARAAGLRRMPGRCGAIWSEILVLGVPHSLKPEFEGCGCDFLLHRSHHQFSGGCIQIHTGEYADSDPCLWEVFPVPMKCHWNSGGHILTKNQISRIWTLLLVAVVRHE